MRHHRCNEIRNEKGFFSNFVTCSHNPVTKSETNILRDKPQVPLGQDQVCTAPKGGRCGSSQRGIVPDRGVDRGVGESGNLAVLLFQGNPELLAQHQRSATSRRPGAEPAPWQHPPSNASSMLVVEGDMPVFFMSIFLFILMSDIACHIPGK